MRFINGLWSLIGYCICLSISLKIQFSKAQEYLIRSGHIPSYLEASFKYADEDAFPAKLTINISITKFAGTLLHTVDHKDNEVSILLSEEGNDQFFNVSLNSNSVRINSNSLCKCDLSCANIVLVLTVRMATEFSLQCNSQAEEVHKFNGNKNRNFRLKEEKNVKGIIWLVNTPNFGPLHSNVYQMEGRLFNVEYNGNYVKLKRYGDAIVDPSKVACNATVCNGGECHVTYSDEPLCDCTKSFGSGRKCHDESRTINRKFYQTFQFGGIKISWRSESSSIFEIGNKRRKLQVIKEDKNLMFLSKADIIQVPLTNDYKTNESYVLLIWFEETKIHIELQLIGSKITLPSSVNLNREMFDYMTLASEKGVIDVAYKINMSEKSWKKWELKYETTESPNATDASTNNSTDYAETTSPQILSSDSSNFSIKPMALGSMLIYVVASVTAGVLLVVLLVIVVCKRKQKKIITAEIIDLKDDKQQDADDYNPGAAYERIKNPYFLPKLPEQPETVEDDYEGYDYIGNTYIDGKNKHESDVYDTVINEYVQPDK